MRSTLLVLLLSSCLLSAAYSRDLPAKTPKLSKLPKCDLANPYTTVKPKWFHRPLPGKFNQWSYDGISPFGNPGAKIKGSDISIPLVGRGNANPLSQDPFGAGLRLSSKYAYKAGKVCATLTIPNPTSGTVFGLYLIDVHPEGSTRSSATWREADLEWLGLKPEEVQTSVFEMGREQPNAQEYQTAGPLQGATQKDPIRYCIEWDLTKPGKDKFVRFTAKSKSTTAMIREWKPSSDEVASFWNEPLRAIITFWSNNTITGWSGSYNIPTGTTIWAHLKDVALKPKGKAYCPKPDKDLQPSS